MTTLLAQTHRKTSKNWRGAIAGVGLAVALSSISVAAVAQSEPTMQQVSQAVQSGQLDKAQSMMDQVLAAHPNSAKAYFFQAEIDAKQGKNDNGRAALAKAEKLAPGLPFAKAESVAQLKKQLGLATAAAPSAPASNVTGTLNGAPLPAAGGATAPASESPARVVNNTPAASAASGGIPWGMILGLGGIAAVAAFVMRRRRAGADAQTFAPNHMQQPANGMVPANHGNNGFGNNGFGNNAGMPYGQQTMAAGSGLGGRLAGGLATGAAIGVGMMAAQAIGRTLSGDEQHNRDADQRSGNNGNSNGFEPLPNQTDNNNFGVNSNAGWDDNAAPQSSPSVDTSGGWDSGGSDGGWGGDSGGDGGGGGE
jgi:uncharacterized protein